MTDNTGISQILVGALPAGTALHEYVVERVLGHGGFGITYLCRDVNLDKKVAIKEYLPNDLAARAADQTVTIRSEESREAFKWGKDSFIKEARVLGKFSHPSLIAVHRYFEANQTAYFVMEFAEGVTLANYLKREGTLSEEKLRKILFPILNGLEEVHRLGVLHRDIKPDNIILRDGAIPVLIDFGAARQNLSSMTRSVMSVLTAGYAPIEQYATTGNQGPWTDLYALGAVAYRALSGKKPIDAVNRIRDDPMVPASVIGQGRYATHFLKAIDWALAVNPEDRPSSVSEWKRALDGQLTPPEHIRTGHTGPSDRTPIAPRNLPEISEFTDPEGPTEMVPKGAAAPGLTRIPGMDRLASLPPWTKWAALGGATVLVLGLGLFFSLRKTVPPKETPAVAEAPTQAPTTTPPPSAPGPTPPPSETKPATTTTPAPAVKPAPAKPAAKKPAAPTTPAKPRMVPVAEMPPLSTFQDCPTCPSMVALAAGTYQMGAVPADNANKWEGPAHKVTLPKPFAIGKNEVTVTEWKACVAAKACPAAAPGPASGDPAKAPVVNVNWGDAQGYVTWLSKQTGRKYRLPSESEWEYAIRARTAGARYWGGDRTLQCRFGNGADQSALKKDKKLPAVECDDGYAALAPVGTFEPNAFGLYDMAGNAWEWVEDCWRDSYTGAPADGSALEFVGCDRRVIRGGSWRARANSLRSFGRGNSPPDVRSDDLGLRVVAE